jgi:chromosome segregation ATPase
MQELEKENFDLKHQIFHLKEKLGTRAASASEGANLIEDNILLEKQVKELEAENQKKAHSLHSYQQLLIKTRTAIQSLEQQNKTNAQELSKQISHAGSLTTTLHAKESLLEQAQQEIGSLQPKLQAANGHLQLSRQRIEDLTAKGKQQEAQLSELDGQLSEVRTKLQSTDKELQDNKMDVARLYGAAQAMAEDDGVTKAALTDQRQSLEQSQNQCSTLSLEVGRLTAKCDALTQQVTELERGSKLLLEQKHVAMQSAQQKTAEVEQLKQTVQSKQNSLDDKERELQHLGAEREQQLTSAKQQWCQELAEADRRQQRMKGTFDQHHHEAVTKRAEEKLEWQERLGSLTAEVTELSQAKVQLEAQVRSLMHEGEQVTRDNREVGAKADSSSWRRLAYFELLSLLQMNQLILHLFVCVCADQSLCSATAACKGGRSRAAATGADGSNEHQVLVVRGTA